MVNLESFLFKFLQKRRRQRFCKIVLTSVFDDAFLTMKFVILQNFQVNRKSWLNLMTWNLNTVFIIHALSWQEREE